MTATAEFVCSSGPRVRLLYRVEEWNIIAPQVCKRLGSEGIRAAEAYLHPNRHLRSLQGPTFIQRVAARCAETKTARNDLAIEPMNG
jgi:hypothetical protein